jgi:hypothetical protein
MRLVGKPFAVRRDLTLICRGRSERSRLERRRALGDGQDRRIRLDKLLLEIIDVGAALDTCAHVRQDTRRRIARNIA